MSRQCVTFKGVTIGQEGRASVSVWFPDQSNCPDPVREVNGGVWLYVPESQLYAQHIGTGIADDEVTVSKWWADKAGLQYEDDQVSREG